MKDSAEGEAASTSEAFRQLEAQHSALVHKHALATDSLAAEAKRAADLEVRRASHSQLTLFAWLFLFYYKY